MKKITARNLIYSTLAIALASSYIYVQSQTNFNPVVASDAQSTEKQLGATMKADKDSGAVSN